MPTASSLSAKQVHASIVRAVADVERAEKNLVLWFGEMLERELFRDLGFSSIYQYAAVKLSFSRSKTAQLVQVCRSLRELPRLREAVGTGEVPWTKARTVVPVATPRTEARWVQEAKTNGRQTLQRKVTATRKAARRTSAADTEIPFDEPITETAPREAPVDVTIRFSPTEYARYEALLAALGPDPTPTKILEALSILARERGRGEKRPPSSEGSPSGSAALSRRMGEPAYQVVVRRCPDCEAGSIPTTRGDLPVDPVTLRQVACDSREERNGRNAAVIPPSVRRKILERDGHRCRSAGCGRTRHLEVHHRVPRVRGGSNRPDNLITLCSGCHRATHRHAETCAPGCTSGAVADRAGGEALPGPPVAHSPG